MQTKTVNKQDMVLNPTDPMNEFHHYPDPFSERKTHFALIGYKEVRVGFDIFLDGKVMNTQLITVFTGQYFDKNIQTKCDYFEQIKHHFNCDGAIVINLTELIELLDNPHGSTDGITQQHDCFMVAGHTTKLSDSVIFYDQGLAYSSENWDHANVESIGLKGVFEQFSSLFIDENGDKYSDDYKGMILTPNTTYLLEQWYWKAVKQEKNQ